MMKRMSQGWDLDEPRCSCGFPKTNVECESLLSGINPTEAPIVDSNVGAGDDGSAGGEGADGEVTPTWVIVTAIAMVRTHVMVLFFFWYGGSVFCAGYMGKYLLCGGSSKLLLLALCVIGRTELALVFG